MKTFDTTQVAVVPPPIVIFDWGRLGGGRVLAAKRANTLVGTRPQADTSKLEGEIKQLARSGQLYGLTDEEIEIVEGKRGI